ncbi:MAG: DMT family transporter [Hyphomicrobiales bacterium]
MLLSSANRNLAGVVSLALGVMIFSTQDAIIKSVSGDHAVTQAIVIRGLVALPILALLVQYETGLGHLRSRNFRTLIVRGLIMLVAYTTYYLAFPALPLAEAIALFFIAPIYITIMAGPLLGERVTLKSWLAVLAGFAGVLIILQPGSALFEPAALLSLVSAATYALSMIIARRLGVSEPATVMAFYQNAVYLTGAAVMAGLFALTGVERFGHPSLDFLVRPWTWPALDDLLLMGACGIIAAIAASLLTHAYRMAEANLVTVFEYTGMIWGPLWGFLFFAEIPRWTTFAGMALIAAAGIYAVRAASPEPN